MESAMKYLSPYSFSPYSKPSKPNLPPKQITHFETIQTIRVSNYSSESFSAPEADYVYVEIEDNYGDHTIIITFSKVTIIDNPNYKKQYENYQKDLVKYKENMKSWKEDKKKWDE